MQQRSDDCTAANNRHNGFRERDKDRQESVTKGENPRDGARRALLRTRLPTMGVEPRCTPSQRLVRQPMLLKAWCGRAGQSEKPPTQPPCRSVVGLSNSSLSVPGPPSDLRFQEQD